MVLYVKLITNLFLSDLDFFRHDTCEDWRSNLVDVADK